jgi:hypothetical protein
MALRITAAPKFRSRRSQDARPDPRVVGDPAARPGTRVDSSGRGWRLEAVGGGAHTPPLARGSSPCHPGRVVGRRRWAVAAAGRGARGVSAPHRAGAPAPTYQRPSSPTSQPSPSPPYLNGTPLPTQALALRTCRTERPGSCATRPPVARDGAAHGFEPFTAHRDGHAASRGSRDDNTRGMSTSDPRRSPASDGPDLSAMGHRPVRTDGSDALSGTTRTAVTVDAPARQCAPANRWSNYPPDGRYTGAGPGSHRPHLDPLERYRGRTPLGFGTGIATAARPLERTRCLSHLPDKERGGPERRAPRLPPPRPHPVIRRKGDTRTPPIRGTEGSIAKGIPRHRREENRDDGPRSKQHPPARSTREEGSDQGDGSPEARSRDSRFATGRRRGARPSASSLNIGLRRKPRAANCFWDPCHQWTNPLRAVSGKLVVGPPFLLVVVVLVLLSVVGVAGTASDPGTGAVAPWYGGYYGLRIEHLLRPVSLLLTSAVVLRHVRAAGSRG